MSNKTLVLYVFHKFNDRVEHFIKHAIFDAPNVNFVIMCNDPTFDIKSKVPPGVKTFNRENKGYDFGGWSDLLLKHRLAFEPSYDTYLFVNSSVIGPFMGEHADEQWTDIFRKGLNEDVKLFGVTINCCQKPLTFAHVQSYLFAMSKQTVHDLIKDGLFSEKYVNNFLEAILDKEVRMSRLIIERGGNIGSTHRYYGGVDFRFKYKMPQDYNIDFLGDIMYPKHQNKLWTSDELVFIKGNRKAEPVKVIFIFIFIFILFVFLTIQYT